MSLQFVSCNDTSCPLNQSKQCRAPFIFVDENGTCSIRNAGPHDNKAEVETYVDLKRCDCTKCDNWEEDLLGAGTCGFRGNLFFTDKNICHEFEKQVGEPGFATIVK
jgi:hypothetical protein